MPRRAGVSTGHRGPGPCQARPEASEARCAAVAPRRRRATRRTCVDQSADGGSRRAPGAPLRGPRPAPPRRCGPRAAPRQRAARLAPPRPWLVACSAATHPAPMAPGPAARAHARAWGPGPRAAPRRLVAARRARSEAGPARCRGARPRARESAPRRGHHAGSTPRRQRAPPAASRRRRSELSGGEAFAGARPG
jgi:hypothetical protein